MNHMCSPPRWLLCIAQELPQKVLPRGVVEVSKVELSLGAKLGAVVPGESSQQADVNLQDPGKVKSMTSYSRTCCCGGFRAS